MHVYSNCVDFFCYKVYKHLKIFLFNNYYVYFLFKKLYLCMFASVSDSNKFYFVLFFYFDIGLTNSLPKNKIINLSNNNAYLYT